MHFYIKFVFPQFLKEALPDSFSPFIVLSPFLVICNVQRWQLTFWDFLALFSFPTFIWTFYFHHLCFTCPAWFWFCSQQFLLNVGTLLKENHGKLVSRVHGVFGLDSTFLAPLMDSFHLSNIELSKTSPNFNCCFQISLMCFPVISC